MTKTGGPSGDRNKKWFGMTPPDECPDASAIAGVCSQEAAYARVLLKGRRRRDDMLGGDVFADPAWDMMLFLFVGRIERRRIAKSDLAVAAAVPASTAFRKMVELIASDLIHEYPDPADGRRTFSDLTDCAFVKLAEVLRQNMADYETYVGNPLQR
jgi:hypothetical protein